MNPATKAAGATGSVGLLMQLSKVVYRRASEDVIGIKLKQLMALEQLREKEGCLQQALASSLMLDANNCVILLNELDERGYIERRRDPEDRRRHLVEVTATGLKALARAEEKLETLEEQVLGNLSQAERSELHQLLLKALADSERSE